MTAFAGLAVADAGPDGSASPEDPDGVCMDLTSKGPSQSSRSTIDGLSDDAAGPHSESSGLSPPRADGETGAAGPARHPR